MPTTSLPVVLALTLAVVAPAQDGTESQPPKWDRDAIVAHLGSAARDEVAWAAWLVRRDGMKSTVPQLRAALARLAGDDGIESQLARLQILDALIEFEVDLPGEELLPHAVGRLRVPALVLAARNPKQNASYFMTRFDALMELPDVEWCACGNLLSEQIAPGLARRCLRRVEFVLNLVVEAGGVTPGRLG